jgi:hypothetical protein
MTRWLALYKSCRVNGVGGELQLCSGGLGGGKGGGGRGGLIVMGRMWKCHGGMWAEGTCWAAMHTSLSLPNCFLATSDLRALSSSFSRYLGSRCLGSLPAPPLPDAALPCEINPSHIGKILQNLRHFSIAHPVTGCVILAKQAVPLWRNRIFCHPGGSGCAPGCSA